MEWCRLYARLRHDAEVQNLTDSAFRLFVESLCYATEAESDGHVPTAQLVKFGKPGTKRNAAALVAAQLWSRLEDGWVITKWQTLQEDLETVRKRRKRDADRKAEARAAKASPNGVVRGGVHGGLPGGVLVVEEIEKKPPPTPPLRGGGNRCAVHKRSRRGCDDCAAPPLAAVPDWCGDCESDAYRWLGDGPDLRKCPRCHPSVVRSA